MLVGGPGSSVGSTEEGASVGQRERDKRLLREQITGVFHLAASHRGWFWSVDVAWEKSIYHTAPLWQYRYCTQRNFLSDLTYFSPLCSQLELRQQKQIRFGKDAYTQYTGGDNAMNVNYTAVIWRYDSI